jgi:hypothetical protein
MKQNQGLGRSTTTTVREQVQPKPDDDLYAVAMLKVAMEMKRSNSKGFEEIFEETLLALGVDRKAFRGYLSRHMDRLVTTAKRRGY